MELLNKQNKQNISPDNAEPQANVAGICLLSDLHKQWIIDSGATDHICSNIDLFYDYAKYIGSSDSITIADGKKVKIEHVGTIHFDNGIILTGVLHVPDFKYNLISATKLCQDLKCMITFTHDKYYIQDYSQKTLQVLGELRSGLYAVDGTSPIFHKDKSKAVFLSLSEESKLWHLRLAHMPFNKLVHVKPGLKSNTSCDYFCTICPKARQTRLSFPVSSSHTNKCFQLLHVDIWGPYRAKTHDNCSMFLTVVDDFSRHTWVFLLKNKTEVVPVLSQFAVYVQVQFGTKIMSIRTDNAQELCEGDLKHFYLTNGIIHQTSCRDTPQQNGIVERNIDIY
ncbi:Retrovirus-related Pol polyprotein from transposon RE1 [Bienertia sinuspersici]